MASARAWAVVLAPLAGAASGHDASDELWRLGFSPPSMEPAVEVMGATGANAFLLGAYSLTDRMAPNSTHPCYHKDEATASGEVWLCVDRHGRWSFQPEHRVGGDGAYMTSGQSEVDRPTQAKSWSIWDGGAWAPSESILVVPRADAENSAEMWKVRCTIAWMIFGAFVANLVSLRLLRSRRALLRAHSFRMLSSTIETFMSVLFVGTLTTIIFEQALPAGGLSRGSSVVPTAHIIIVFTLFTVSYFFMNYLGWKFQHSRPLLQMLRSFFCSIVSWSAVNAFTQVQKQATKLVASEANFIGPIGPEELAAASVLVLAWFIFALFREASKGMRLELEAPSGAGAHAKAPVSRWASVPMAAHLTCMGDAGATDEERPDWREEVCEAEEDVAVSTLGFLFNQVLVFGLAGHMNGLPGHFAHHTVEKTSFWLVAAGVAFVVSATIFVLRAKCCSGGVPGHIVQRISINAIGFCLFRWNNWAMKNRLAGDDEPSADLICAIVFSVLSIVTVILSGLVAPAIERALPESFRRLHPRQAAGASRLDPLDWATKTITKCFGMLVGISWKRAFSDALDTIVEETPAFEGCRMVVRVLLSAAFLSLLVRPWYTHVLPRAEMTEKEHALEIEQETKAWAAAAE